MDRMVKVTFQNKIVKEFPVNTTLEEISRSFKDDFNYPIMIAKVDNNLAHLGKTITKKSDVDFYDRSSIVGNSVYASSVQLMLIVAIKRVLGRSTDVMIEHSIDKGIYCELVDRKITEDELKEVEKEMFNLVKEDLIFTRVSVARTDAIKYFKKEKQLDKVKVLKYISNSYVTLYRLDDIYDYFFGEMAYSTKTIDDFKLNYINENGFVLAYPNIYNPECTLDYVHHKSIFDKFLDYTNWGKAIGIETAADLNEVVSTGKYNEVIRLSEAHYEAQLAEISEIINQRRNEIKLVLISGPSASGKKTTAKKLSVYLQSKGFKTHNISIDDYLYDRKDTSKKENGDYDFESVKAIDMDLFNKHLTKLLDGEKVLLPKYNFVLGKKEYKNHLQIKENDIILIEGIHALNDELTMAIEDKYKYKIYISTLTQLNVDNHNRIHTSDTRRLRRIIYGNKHYGTMPVETLKMWKDIRENEEKYIFPYQDSADVVINTALVYELGVLKTYVEPLLFSVPEDDEVYHEALRLISFLRNFLPIPSDEVPRDSILREFIGGSGFYDN